jgi:hypothetical protein
MKRQWQRFRDWWTVNRHSKRGLGVGEVFYRLAVWQRWILILGCFGIAAFWVSMPFSASILPHWFQLYNADGSLNGHELRLIIGLTGTVIYMALFEFIWKSKDVSLFFKVGGIFLCALCLWTNFGTGTTTLTVDREDRATVARNHNKRIDDLTQEIKDQNKAWQEATKPTKRTTAGMVAVIKAASDELARSAREECKTGPNGMTRGPRCKETEDKRNAKYLELATAESDKGLTDFITGIEQVLTNKRDELSNLGAKIEHIEEGDGFQAAMMNYGVSKERAAGIVQNKPATDVLNFELLSAFATSPTIMLWIRFMAFLTCQTGEAEERVKDLTMKVAADHANRAAANQNEAPAPKESARPFTLFDTPNEEKKPEADHAEVLGIEGEDPPAFVSDPQTTAEAMAAAFIKADKTKKPRRARKKAEPSAESVLLHHKERAVARDGRNVDSDEYIRDYKIFCHGLNLEPVEPQKLGRILRQELGIEKKKSGGKMKYLNIGLRPTLRVVSG